jgi:hypothetical protein
MLLECSCGKMFRVRDGTATPPNKCPSCGGTLREAGGRVSGPPSGVAAAPPASAGDAGRVKELEGRIAELEKVSAASRATAESKARELEEMAGRLAQAQKAKEEAAQDAAKAKADSARKEKDGGDKAGRIQQLEKDLQEARVKGQQAGLAAIKEKDAELHYAQERIAALEREVQGSQGGTKTREKELIDLRARVSSMQAEHKESQEAIAKLGDELHKAQDAYKATLANKEKEIEDLHAKLGDSGGGTKGPGGDSPGLQRAQSRIAMLEKIVQDGEQRYRTLQEEFHKSTQNAHSTTAAGSRAIQEKDAKIVDLEAAVSRQKNRADELEKKVKSADAERESAKGVPVPAGNFDQARYLAADLDRSLGSISSMLQGLVERVKRLNQTLTAPAGAAPAALAPAAPLLAAAKEEPPAPAPTWGRPAAPPADEETKADLDPVVEESPQEADLDVEAPASPEEEAEPVELESLPDAVPAPEEESALPADETLLDMGGASMGKKVRDAMARRRKPPTPLPAEEPVEASFEEAPVQEEGQPVEEAAPEVEADQPKKKGLFGKLFGRKK